MRMEEYGKWKDPSITDEEWEDIVSSPSNINWENLTRKQYIEAVLQEEEEDERQRLLLREYLKDLGVVQLKNIFSRDEIEQEWKRSFCPNLSAKEQKSCYMDQFLWHAFTYEKILPWLSGDEAKARFDQVKKDDMYIFWENKEEVYHISAPDSLKCYMLRLLYNDDIYFVDGSFTWTFILTHEYEIIWYSLDEMP